MAAPSPVGGGNASLRGHLFSPQPSEVDTDTEEYKSQNSTETDLEFEEHEGAIMLKESLDLQVNGQQIWSWGNLAILSWKDTSVLPLSAAKGGFWDAFIELLIEVLCCPSLELQSDLSPYLQLNNAQPDGDNPEPLATSSEQGQEDPAASSSAEDASNDDSGDSDTQTPQDVSSRDSSEQEADVEHESSSSSQSGVRILICACFICPPLLGKMFQAISAQRGFKLGRCPQVLRGLLGQLSPQLHCASKARAVKAVTTLWVRRYHAWK